MAAREADSQVPEQIGHPNQKRRSFTVEMHEVEDPFK
jgi:hypothetical protein